MKTTVWLKSQPKKKLEYPDCYPLFNDKYAVLQGIFVKDNTGRNQASYSIELISRIEFRP